MGIFEFGLGWRSKQQIMTKKRRNNGKNRKGRGHVRFVRCEVSGRAVPKDKAVTRYQVRPIVDQSSLRDIDEMSVYQETDQIQIGRTYCKQYYSISAAVHKPVVRARPKKLRKIRESPKQRRRNDRNKKDAQKKK